MPTQSEKRIFFWAIDSTLYQKEKKNSYVFEYCRNICMRGAIQKFKELQCEMCSLKTIKIIDYFLFSGRVILKDESVKYLVKTR